MGQLSEEYRQLIEEDFELAELERTYISLAVSEGGSPEETHNSIEALIAAHNLHEVLELRTADFPKYGLSEMAICRLGTSDIVMMLPTYGHLYGDFHHDVPKEFIMELLQYFQTTRPGFILEYVARNGHAYEPDMIEQSSGDYNWILVEVML